MSSVFVLLPMEPLSPLPSVHSKYSIYTSLGKTVVYVVLVMFKGISGVAKISISGKSTVLGFHRVTSSAWWCNPCHRSTFMTEAVMGSVFMVTG